MSEQVDQLCRLWRAVLARRDALAEDAQGNDGHATNARASLKRLVPPSANTWQPSAVSVT